jgi:hypothetical protein
MDGTAERKGAVAIGGEWWLGREKDMTAHSWVDDLRYGDLIGSEVIEGSWG